VTENGLGVDGQPAGIPADSIKDGLRVVS
jgi:hypothetical protein